MNIRHRFIVRNRDDFRVFAAIPVSAPILKWVEWDVPVDREALDDFFAVSLVGIEVVLGHLADARMALLQLNPGEEETSELAMAIVRVEASLCERRDYIRVRMGQTEWSDIQELLDVHIFDALNPVIEKSGRNIEEAKHKILSALDRLDKDARANVVTEIRKQWPRLKDTLVSPMDCAERAWTTYSALLEPAKPMLVAAEEKAILNATCPEGLPYAHYTIEFQPADDDEWTRVIIVEGCAWIKGRGATEAERRVTEIVSQMLTERAANPRAETRIAMVESDPAAAHQARQALARGSKMRTIRFNVTPPRYLRAAAEQILTSKRKAHWVVGHWRNQPHGPGRSLREKRWIAPHIRGLGEASATVAAVAAPRHHAA